MKTIKQQDKSKTKTKQTTNKNKQTYNSHVKTSLQEALLKITWNIIKNNIVSYLENKLTPIQFTMRIS